MCTTVKVLSLISRCKFAVAKNLVSLFLRKNRELRIGCTTIDEKRYFGGFEVFLVFDGINQLIIRREIAGMSPTSRSSGILRREG